MNRLKKAHDTMLPEGCGHVATDCSWKWFHWKWPTSAKELMTPRCPDENWQCIGKHYLALVPKTEHRCLNYYMQINLLF